jgi:hypothetical protein
MFLEVVANVLSARSEFLRKFTDERRDVEKECGYPSSHSGLIDEDMYQRLYEREAIAARVVEVFPRESWQIQPKVYEVEDNATRTGFEEDWRGIGRNLRGYSYHQEERGSPVWEYLQRVDIQSGIGHAGLLLLGIDDKRPLNEPANGADVDGMPTETGDSRGYELVGPDGRKVTGAARVSFDKPSASGRKLVYLRVFPESLFEVARFETDETSPRFGQPVAYNVDFNDPRVDQAGTGTSISTREVHWTRVIHVADNLASSEVFGVPRMRPVLNRILDLQKLYAGSAEMYWRGAFPGWAFESHPQLGGDVEMDLASIRRQMEDWQHGLQRFLGITGLTVKSLAPQVVDPSPQITRQIEAICIKLGIPKRIFMGSERGELASGQDDAAWNDRLRERHKNYLTPRLIVPLVDRLIWMGVLREPKGYSVWWPDLASQTAQEKAQVTFQLTQALAQYVTSKAWMVMALKDFFTLVFGLDEDEAASVINNLGPDAMAMLRAGQMPQNVPERQLPVAA